MASGIPILAQLQMVRPPHAVGIVDILGLANPTHRQRPTKL
jgi:hypothetical protein